MNGDRMLTAGRRMLSVVLGVILLAATVALTGCGSAGGPAPVRTELVPFTPEQQQQISEVRDAEYRFRCGDQVALDFKFEDSLDRSRLLVLPDGRITLPGGVDPVMARGLTVPELDKALTAAYAIDYRSPELSVMIETLAELHVYVMGYVQHPGAIKVPAGGLSLLQAVAAAGGYHKDADASQTVVMRVTPEGFMLRQIDLSHLEKRGIIDLVAMDLQPYDVIYVPRSAIGDLSYFTSEFVGSLLSYGDLFFDVYTITNLHKVENIWRR